MNLKPILVVFCLLLTICTQINAQKLLGKYCHEKDYLDFKSDSVVAFKLESSYEGTGTYEISNGTIKINFLQLPENKSEIELVGSRKYSDSLTVYIYDKESGKPFRSMANIFVLSNGRSVAHDMLTGEYVRYPMNKIAEGMEIGIYCLAFSKFYYPITNMNSDIIIRYAPIIDSEITKQFLDNEGFGFNMKSNGDTIFLQLPPIIPKSVLTKSDKWMEFIKEKN